MLVFRVFSAHMRLDRRFLSENKSMKAAIIPCSTFGLHGRTAYHYSCLHVVLLSLRKHNSFLIYWPSMLSQWGKEGNRVSWEISQNEKNQVCRFYEMQRTKYLSSVHPSSIFLAISEMSLQASAPVVAAAAAGATAGNSSRCEQGHSYPSSWTS